MLKRLNIILILLFGFSFGGTLLGDESANKYFPSTVGSFWVYEDQDGNELTRHAIEGEEIAGKTFSAFSYEPELEDWAKYSPLIRPSLYNVSDAGITLVVGDEIEKAAKARLKKEMNVLVEAIKADNPPGTNLDVDIEAQAQEHFFFLPDAIPTNEEWDANQLEAKIKLTFREGDDVEGEQMIIDFTIIETGIILGKETIDTAAGKFEDCLKVEYRTETTGVITPTPPPPAADPPGETVTTVWYAPNVGIVKFRQKMKYSFLEMIPDEELPLPANPKPKTFELKKYEIKSADTESIHNNSKAAVKSAEDTVETKKAKPSSEGAQRINYFPGMLDSFWVYEDQDGNELTRHTIEGEEIAGKTFSAFSYEPELEDWAEYSPFIQPALYQVSDAGITLVVKEEIEKALQARLKKETDILVDMIKRGAPADAGIDVDIEVKGRDHSFLLPDAIIINEEWDVNQFEVNVKMNFLDGGIPEGEQLVIDFTIIETAIISGTETVETPAGKFEDCLKVEYRTETTAVMTPTPPPDEVEPPGETGTTVWYAPNVGIVQFQQETNYIFLEMLPDDEGFPVPPGPKTKTFELKKYEIKSAESESDSSKK